MYIILSRKETLEEVLSCSSLFSGILTEHIIYKYL